MEVRGFLAGLVPDAGMQRPSASLVLHFVHAKLGFLFANTVLLVARESVNIAVPEVQKGLY